MNAPGWALFDTTLGRCGLAWSAAGLTDVGLPHASESLLVARVRRHYGAATQATPPDEQPDAVRRAIVGIQALYRTSNTEEKLLSYLMFKKTLKVELATISHLSVGTYNAKDHTAECELKQKDGMDLSVTLLATFPIDGKPATLLGFVGTVPAGYRLFPVHTITQFEPAVEKK